MKQKDFEKSMSVILGNLRNASHVSKELLKSSNADLAAVQKMMLVDPEILYQMQTIIDEYEKFSTMACLVSVEFSALKAKIERVVQEGEQDVKTSKIH